MNYLKSFNNSTEYESDQPNFLHPHVSFIKDDKRVIYEKTAHDYSQDYLTFEALENSTFKFSGNTVEYSLDEGETWTTLASNTDTPTVSAGNKIMFRSNIYGDSTNGIGKFSSIGRFKAMGNVASMTDYVNFSGVTSVRSLTKMFFGCSGLTDASKLVLPATSLSANCYTLMFFNCANLEKAPATLPATTLKQSCYDSMFAKCASLTTAPTLPSTELTYACYHNMFSGCTSLTVAPELPATSLHQNCYDRMFAGCTALTTAPELPATTVYRESYKEMFSGCTSLNYIKMLATDISADRCIYSWVDGVAQSGTFVKNASMSSLPSGNSGIPSGWTVINA